MRVESQYIFPDEWERKHEWDRYVRWGKKGLAVELSDLPGIQVYEIKKEEK